METVYAPAYEIRINGSPLSDQVAEDVFSVEFKDGIGLLDQLTIMLINTGNRYTKLKNALVGLEIELWGGWVGYDWGWYFTGKIDTALPSASMSEGEVLTLTAYPVNSKSNWMEERSDAYSGLKRISDVVKEVMSRYHPEFKYVDADGNETIEETPIDQNLNYVLQYEETDIEFCRKLAEYAGGWEFTIKNNCVIFRKPRPTADVVLNVTSIGDNKNLVSWEMVEAADKDSDTVEFFGQDAGDNPETKPNEVEITDLMREEAFRAGEYVATGISSSAGGGSIRMLSFVQSQTINENLAKAAGKAAATEKIKINAEIIDENCRYLRGGSTVNFKVGAYFDGKFYINPEAIHTWDDSGYRVSVQLTNYQPEESADGPE